MGRECGTSGQGKMLPWLRSHVFECPPNELGSVSSVTPTKLVQDGCFCGFGQGLGFLAYVAHSQLKQILMIAESYMYSIKVLVKFFWQFGHPTFLELFYFYYFSPLPVLTTCDLPGGILLLVLHDPLMRSTEKPWGHERFSVMCSSNRQQVRLGARQ